MMFYSAGKAPTILSPGFNDVSPPGLPIMNTVSTSNTGKVFAGGNNGVMMFSSDSVNWDAPVINTAFTGNPSGQILASTFTSTNNTLVLGGWSLSGVVSRSVDDGATWIANTTDMAARSVTDLTTGHTGVVWGTFTGSFAYARKGGFFASADGTANNIIYENGVGDGHTDIAAGLARSYTFADGSWSGAKSYLHFNNGSPWGYTRQSNGWKITSMAASWPLGKIVVTTTDSQLISFNENDVTPGLPSQSVSYVHGPNPVYTPWRSVCWSAARAEFFAVGDLGMMASSSDGINWTYINGVPNTYNFRDVAYNSIADCYNIVGEAGGAGSYSYYK